MPTSFKTKRLLLDSLPKDQKGIIYELGSGWGTLIFPLAKQYPNCTVIGYENSPVPFLFAKGWLFFSRDTNLQIKRQDFFKADLKDASLIICYLYPGAMQSLKEKFEKELGKETIIVSHTFAIPQWKAYKIYEVNDLYHTKIYFYTPQVK